jgi:hypothetical protein
MDKHWHDEHKAVVLRHLALISLREQSEAYRRLLDLHATWERESSAPAFLRRRQGQSARRLSELQAAMQVAEAAVQREAAQTDRWVASHLGHPTLVVG